MTRRFLPVPIFVLAALLAAVLLAQPGPMAFGKDTPEFVSQRGCKKCHFKQHRSWKKTIHAKALDILKAGERAEAKKKAGLEPDKDYTKDPSCLACHVTGYGEAGGYPEVKDAWDDAEQKAAKNNAGVGCESCHGAGSLYAAFKADNEEYKRAEVVKLGMKLPVSAENCTGCHNSKSPTQPDDYVFNFDSAKNDVKGVHEHIPLKFDHK